MKYSQVFPSFFFITISIIISLSMTLGTAQTAYGYENIDAPEAKNLIDQNPLVFILDVRTPREYQTGYIFGAVNVHFVELEYQEDELPTDLNHSIIVYCNTGSRSYIAAIKLVQLGYTNIKNIEFGLISWKAEAYPLVLGQTVFNSNPIMAMIVIIGLLIGITLGYILHRGKICINSALKKSITGKDFHLIKTFILTIFIFTAVVNIWNYLKSDVACSGAILPTSFSLITIIAGIMFGVGMLLAEGCITGICYKTGAGYGGALIALIGAILTFFFMIQTPILSFSQKLISISSFLLDRKDFHFSEVFDQEFFLIILSIIFLIVFIISTILILKNPKRLPNKNDFRNMVKGNWTWWFSAIALACIGLIRLVITTLSGFPASLGVTGGLISFTQLLTLNPVYILEGITVVGGLIIGSFFSAKTYGEFQIYFPPRKEKARYFLGGILLASGATLAAGCSFAHLSMGLPKFAFSSIIFLLFAIGTNVLGHYMVKKTSQKIDNEIALSFTNKEKIDSKELVIWTITQLNEPTTTEVMEMASKISSECKDRLSATLASLLNEGKIQKKLSKEKKAIIWSLVS